MSYLRGSQSFLKASKEGSECTLKSVIYFLTLAVKLSHFRNVETKDQTVKYQAQSHRWKQESILKIHSFWLVRCFLARQRAWAFQTSSEISIFLLEFTFYLKPAGLSDSSSLGHWLKPARGQMQKALWWNMFSWCLDTTDSHLDLQPHDLSIRNYIHVKILQGDLSILNYIHVTILQGENASKMVGFHNGG